MLTLGELKEMVDEMVDVVGEEAAEEIEVRFASQPSWPFEYSIEIMTPHEHNKIIYLAEGRQIGYLPGEVKDQLGW